jgi:hypothetical protein
MATPARVQHPRCGPLQLRFSDDLVQGIDRLASLSGPGNNLHRNYQILVGNPQVQCSVAEAFALVKLGANADWQYLRAVAQRHRLLIEHRLDRLARRLDVEAVLLD